MGKGTPVKVTIVRQGYEAPLEFTPLEQHAVAAAVARETDVSAQPGHAPQNVAFDPADHKQVVVTTFGGGAWRGDAGGAVRCSYCGKTVAENAVACMACGCAPKTGSKMPTASSIARCEYTYSGVPNWRASASSGQPSSSSARPWRAPPRPS